MSSPTTGCFNQIADSTVRLESVLPVVTDPSTDSLAAGSLCMIFLQLFDAAYGLLMRLMQRMWATPTNRGGPGLVAALVPMMVRVLEADRIESL